MRRLLVPIALLFALALALSACGSGASPEEEVREAAIEAGRSEDPKVFCRTMVTHRFVEEVFDGDVAACADSEIVDDDPGRPVVEDVAMKDEDATTATVAIRVAGGESGGVTGHLRFAKEGEDWKVDRFETDYMRSVFAVGLEKVDEGALATPAMRDCMGEQLTGLSDDRMRELTLNTIADEASARKDLVALAGKCPGPLAQGVANQIADSLEGDKQNSPAYVRCIREEIAFLLKLTGIAPELIVPEPNEIAVAALAGVAEGAKQNCGK